MSAIKDGGPAFPALHSIDGNWVREPLDKYAGMSLRDYFIAHAPAEPQPWFAPVMPTQPTIPQILNELTEAQRKQFQGLGDYLGEDEVDQAVKDFRRRWSAAVEAKLAWMQEKEKQRLVQWPAAWADEMLAQRAKGGRRPGRCAMTADQIDPPPMPDFRFPGSREGITRAGVLHEAEKIVTRDRQATHGRPEDSFDCIAQLWSAYLGLRVESHDVAAMMALLKLARIRENPKHADNWIDLAGYAACGAEVAS